MNGGSAHEPGKSDPGMLETASKLAVPASIAGYLLGFLMAMPHYARAGVPIHAISAQTFVAAGLLFAVFSGAICLGALALRRSFRRRAGDTRSCKAVYYRRVWGVILGLGVPAGMTYQLSKPDNRPAIVVMMAIGWLATFGAYGIRFSLTLDEWQADLWNGMRAIGLLLPPIALFCLLVYPFIPAQYGGGRPTVLIAYAPGAASALAKHDQWATLPCRWVAGDATPSPTGCRTVYKVHESEQHLYLAIIENDAPCPAIPQEWRQWGLFKKPKKGCFQRVPNTAVDRLETWGIP